MDGLSQQERETIQHRFRSSVPMLIECTAYWIPGERRVAFRSVSVCRRFTMPGDAVYIGRYAHVHGFSPADFLSDLEDVLERLQLRRTVALGV